jgi:hypothetical protein
MLRYQIAFYLLFFVLAGFVQQSLAQQFHGGLTAGLVGSQVAGDTYSGYKKAGIYAGGYVSLDVGERSSLQMELTYFQKGSRENPTEKNGYDYFLFRADYIEMPVLYQYKMGKDKRFTIEAGPSVGFVVSYFEENEVQEESDKAGYNRPAAVSLQFNLGLRWMIGPHFGIDFRTHNSLLNIRKEVLDGYVRRFWNYGQFHDALVLSLFYQIK